MANRIHLTMEDGSKEWIDVSAGIKKEAETMAWNDGLSPREAFGELLGIDLDAFDAEIERD